MRIVEQMPVIIILIVMPHDGFVTDKSKKTHKMPGLSKRVHIYQNGSVEKNLEIIFI